MRKWILKLMVPLLFLRGTLEAAETLAQEKVETPKNKPYCSQITDHLCAQLWDQDHQGTLKTSDGDIQLGWSPKSRLISKVVREDRWALIQAQIRLPSDFKKKSQPLIHQLKELLREEAETLKWARRYNRWDQDWNQLISEVSQDRAYKKYPRVRQTRLSERTQVENSLINKEYYKLMDEVIKAKYLHHPNWLRVVRQFEEIKGHLLREIEGFPYDSEFLQMLVQRVKDVELTLPLMDLDVFDAKKACSETSVNAFYSPGYNKITVCTGMFNGLQSKASTYIILSHELSHAIDPSSSNWLWLREKGRRTIFLQPLIGINKQPMACDAWASMLTEFQAVIIDRTLKAHPFDQLALCLENEKPLKKGFDPAEIDRQIEEDLVDILNYLSNRNLFSTMVIPEYTEFGKQKKNPYFLNPDVFVSEYNEKGYAPTGSSTRLFPYSPEVFYQVIQCEYLKQKSAIPLAQFFTVKGSPRREEVLKTAIDSTRKILSLLYEESYFSCGQFCSAFIRKGMARNVDEKFADWMSFRIFYRYLKSLKNQEDRLQASGLALANLCDRPSVRQEAGSLLNIEKTYSIESHPEDRVRRLALYNQEISTLLDCIPETQEKWGSCQIQDPHKVGSSGH